MATPISSRVPQGDCDRSFPLGQVRPGARSVPDSGVVSLVVRIPYRQENAMAEGVNSDLSVERFERYRLELPARFGSDAVVGFAQRATCCPIRHVILEQP